MKIYRITIAAILSVLIISACNNTSRQAMDYYNNIYSGISYVLKCEDTLIGSITYIRKIQQDSASLLNKNTTDTSSKPDTSWYSNINYAYFLLTKSVDSTTKAFRALPAFKNNTTLKDAAILLLNKYKVVSQKDYNEIIEILKIDKKDYSPEDDTRFQEVSDSINIKLETEIINFNNASQNFAGYYNIDISGE